MQLKGRTQKERRQAASRYSIRTLRLIELKSGRMASGMQSSFWAASDQGGITSVIVLLAKGDEAEHPPTVELVRSCIPSACATFKNIKTGLANRETQSCGDHAREQRIIPVYAAIWPIRPAAVIDHRGLAVQDRRSLPIPRDLSGRD